MIEGLASRHGNPDLREAFLNDPELLDCEVWRLFEVEGNGEFSLAALDKYSRNEAKGRWDNSTILEASSFCQAAGPDDQ
jgi:hypothetical protein